ncbi:hypothetical protein QFZ87_003079 [Bacillus sp. SLBN-46]|nr:hypothetical protein [Bacillus sp. SLBN-46]
MTIKLFAEILKYPFVIIFDTDNGNKLHRTDCSFVTKENYDLKVIINQEKNGYYQPLNSLDIINKSSINICKVCKPYKP